MRWNTKRKPVIGEHRYKVKFAFLPTKFTLGEILWLERYIVKEEFKVYEEYEFCEITGALEEYTTSNWVEVERFYYNKMTKGLL